MQVRSLRSQVIPAIIVLSITLVPATMGLAAIAILAPRAGIDYELLTKDFAAAAQVPFYTGIVSNIGLYLWAAGAAVCLFTFLVLNGGPRRDAAWFALASGLLTAMLFADDAFMVHEVIAPYHLGVEDHWVLLFQLLCTAAYLVVFHRQILASDYLVLAAALGFFTLSLVADKLHDLEMLHVFGSADAAFLIEDGLKFIGIATWCGYFVWTCHAAVTGRSVREPPERAEAGIGHVQPL